MLRKIRKDLAIDGVVIQPMKLISINGQPYSIFGIKGRITCDGNQQTTNGEYQDFKLIMKRKLSLLTYSSILLIGTRRMFFCKTVNDSSGYIECFETSDLPFYFNDQLL